MTKVEVRSFALGETDVTRGQWHAFVEDTHRPDGLGCAYSGLPKEESGQASWRHLGFKQGDDEPVVCVSWNEAQAYVQWLSRRTGGDYRLPTEAEWEYAARAGTTTAYPWGDSASHDRANYGSETCCTSATDGADRWLYTSPVRSFPPNGFGLYDMIGNAWQWTQDCYVDTLSGRPASAIAITLDQCRFRVARGGTWGGHACAYPISSPQLCATTTDDCRRVSQCRLRPPRCELRHDTEEARATLTSGGSPHSRPWRSVGRLDLQPVRNKVKEDGHQPQLYALSWKGVHDERP